MSLRDCVTFIAEFPDDAQWDQKGNLLVPGGKTIAEALRDQLNQRGFSCTQIDQHSDYGWEFDAIWEKGTFWCLLADGGLEHGWLLQIVEKLPFIPRMFGCVKAGAFERFQDCIQEILTGNRRFSKVLWYTNTKSDYNPRKDNQGSPTPR